MPAASIFLEGGSGQSTRRNALFGSRIIVRVFDEMGAWLPGALVRYSLPSSLLVPSGRFPGGTFAFDTLTDGDGRASSEFIEADDLLGTWLGEVEAVANPAVRADFYLSNVSPLGTPVSVVITTNGFQTAAQFTAFQSVIALVVDGDGAGVAGWPVTMTCDPTRGAFPGGSNVAVMTTDSSGNAVFPAFTASGVLGSFGPSITAPSLSQVNANFTTLDAAVAISLSAYAGNHQAIAPSFPFPQQLVARVANGLNSPVAGVNVTFDAQAAAGATLVWSSPFTNPVTRTSDVNGLATSPSFSANATAGTYLVLASSPGLTTIAFELTNGGASPNPDPNPLALCEV